jgi:DNA-binding MarR family transcriptional regulator
VADDDQELRDEDYERLLEFRTGLRRFLRWSEAQSATAGLTPAHHQLMLAVRGHGDPLGPTIRDVADALLLQHHSVVGLVDRAVMAGLVDRHADPDDHRVVRLQLTALGERRLRQLSRLHLEELRRLAPGMRSLWADLDVSTVGATG